MKRLIFILLISIYMVMISIPSVQAISYMSRVMEKESNQPIEMAGIAFLASDSTYMGSCMTDSLGKFDIPDNNLIKLMRISAAGFKPLLSPLHIEADDQEIIIALQPDGFSLDEVTVSAKKQAFVVKQDKILFNPKFAPTAVSAYDILKVAPGIIDTGRTLVMAAKNGMKVLINGKEQKGDMADIILLLKSFQANDVESVEILTAPSAKYTRGEDVGIVNIVLKKRTSDFLGGNTYYGLGINEKITHKLSAGIHYTTSKLFTSFNAYGALAPYKYSETNTLWLGEYLRDTKVRADRNNRQLSLKWALDYFISQKWTISLAALYVGSNLKQDADMTYSYLKESKLIDTKKEIGYRGESTSTASSSAEVSGKLSPKATLTASVDYYGRWLPSTRKQYDDLGVVEVSQRYKTNSSNITGKVNLDFALSDKFLLDFGADYQYTRTKNRADYTSFEEMDLYTDYIYDENEIDIFGQVRYIPNSKFIIDATLRYQNLLMSGENLIQIHDKFRRHTDVFAPSLSIGYSINNRNSVRLYGYYNMAKPTLQSITPTMLYVGANTYRVGNPNLREARHLLVGLPYTYRNLMIEPYFEMLNHGVMETGFVNDEGNQIYTWDNAIRSKKYAIYMYWGWYTLDWMSISASQSISYRTQTSSSHDYTNKANGWIYMLMPNLNFFLTKGKSLIFNVNGNLRTAEETLDGKEKASWNLNLEMTWRISNNWSLSVAGNNILASHRRGTFYMTNSHLEYNNKYSYPQCEITLSYTWGKSTRYSRDRDAKREMDTRTVITN